MKVKELLALNKTANVIGFLDIARQEHLNQGCHAKPRVMTVKAHTIGNKGFYIGTPIEDYNVVSFGVYKPENFDFNFYGIMNVGGQPIPIGDFLVIDIDSRQAYNAFMQLGGRNSLKTSIDKTVEEVIAHFKKMNQNSDLLDARLYGMLARDQKPINTTTVKTPQPKSVYFGVPSQVQFNDEKKVTTLIYHGALREDVTIVKASKDETYNRRVGFLEAFFQANCGLSKNKALKYLKELEALPSVGKKKEKSE